MVGDGDGPSLALPFGGGGHHLAEVLFGLGALQREEEDLARRILILIVCSHV